MTNANACLAKENSYEIKVSYVVMMTFAVPAQLGFNNSMIPLAANWESMRASGCFLDLSSSP